MQHSLITRHDISPLKGKYISKEGHASSKSRDILESERILREFFWKWDENTFLSQFLDSLRTDRTRSLPRPFSTGSCTDAMWSS